MISLDFDYTENLVQDSITQKSSTNGALIIRSNFRTYFITKDFIDLAHKLFYERKNEDKTQIKR